MPLLSQQSLARCLLSEDTYDLLPKLHRLRCVPRIFQTILSFLVQAPIRLLVRDGLQGKVEVKAVLALAVSLADDCAKQAAQFGRCARHRAIAYNAGLGSLRGALTYIIYLDTIQLKIIYNYFLLP